MVNIVTTRKYLRRKRLGIKFGRYRKALISKGQYVRSNMHFFRQAYEFTATTTAGGDYGVAITPTIASFPDLTNITALFSQYKILSFDVEWFPYLQQGNSTLNPVLSTPMIRAFDPTSNTAPTASTDLLQYRNSKRTRWTQPFKMRIYPQVFDADDGTSYGSEPSGKNWHNIGNTGLVHHGLRLYIENTALASIVLGKFIISLNVVTRNQQ